MAFAHKADQTLYKNLLTHELTQIAGMSDTHQITGYIIERIGQVYELIDTPGLNDNLGKYNGLGGESGSRILLEGLRAAICQGSNQSSLSMPSYLCSPPIRFGLSVNIR